jgi:hypothetical protein
VHAKVVLFWLVGSVAAQVRQVGRYVALQSVSLGAFIAEREAAGDAAAVQARDVFSLSIFLSLYLSLSLFLSLSLYLSLSLSLALSTASPFWYVFHRSPPVASFPFPSFCSAPAVGDGRHDSPHAAAAVGRRLRAACRDGADRRGPRAHRAESVRHGARGRPRDRPGHYVSGACVSGRGSNDTKTISRMCQS